MTFNSFLSCLMSKESMEITINTSKCHEHAKQWNGNSHISSHKLTGSHFIVILFTTQCQLYIWELSHPFSPIVAFVYKLLWFPYLTTSSMYSNVTTSTRINSSSVHTYICVCFIQNRYNTFQLHSTLVCWPIIQQQYLLDKFFYVYFKPQRWSHGFHWRVSCFRYHVSRLWAACQ